MENIILLALFTYPGAIADGVYTWLARDKSFYAQPDTAFRAARDFFLSALIAVITMPLVIRNADGVHTLENWVDVMQKHEVVWAYIIMSVLCAVLLGWIWYLVRRYPLMWFQNWFATKDGRAAESPNSTVWSDIINTPNEVKINRCAVAIKKNGEIVRAGLPYSLPFNISEEPALSLMYCDLVERELSVGCKSEKILGLQCTYHDLKTGIELEFYDAEPFWKEMDKHAKDHNATSSLMTDYPEVSELKD